MKYIYRLYAFLFGRNIFSKPNKLLYQLSLRGLGILNFEGEYLPGEKSFLKKYLVDIQSPVIIDVGANKGDYASHALSANPNAQIYCFEPHPKIFPRLVERFKDHHLIFPQNYGVGDNTGVLKLYDYESNDGSSHASLYSKVITDLHKSERACSHEVDSIRLDEFLKNNNIKGIDLLKIDTEGNEYKCLLGLGEYLNKDFIQAIHFEFNEMNIVSKSSFKGFWDLLSENFMFYRILPGGGLLPIKDYSPINCEIYAFQNIIAINKCTT